MKPEQKEKKNPKEAKKKEKKKEKKLAIKHKCKALNNSTLIFEKIIMNPWLGDIKLMKMKNNEQVSHLRRVVRFKLSGESVSVF